ncbi:MAG: hypothetical protein LUC92_02415 [Clostridiales bacterium]|nr:hypothetical protein [Clostridiales bacterium]
MVKIIKGINQTVIGITSQEFHLSTVCQALPVACDAFNALAAAVREYHYSFCMSSLSGCQTRFNLKY